MFWIRFRRTSAWVGSAAKVFFYKTPPPIDIVPGSDGAIISFTRPQLEAFVQAGKEALAKWPEEF